MQEPDSTEQLERFLEQAQQQARATRREAQRRKCLARERETQQQERPAGASAAALRLASKLRQHWRSLTLLALIGLASIPLAPLLLVCVLTQSGRDWLWRVSSRLGATGDLMRELFARLKNFAQSAGAISADQAPASKPLLLSRHVDLTGHANDPANNLASQLSPQRRQLLQRLQYCEPTAPLPDMATLSLSRSESSILHLLGALCVAPPAAELSREQRLQE